MVLLRHCLMRPKLIPPQATRCLRRPGALGPISIPGLLGSQKPVKRYEHLAGFAYWGPELLDLGERGDGLLGAHLRGGHGTCFRGERY